MMPNPKQYYIRPDSSFRYHQAILYKLQIYNICSLFLAKVTLSSQQIRGEKKKKVISVSPLRFLGTNAMKLQVVPDLAQSLIPPHDYSLSLPLKLRYH